MYISLTEYEDIYGQLDYDTYIIIVFGMRNNVKYCKFIKNKNEAFEHYNKIFSSKKYDFSSCDERGYNIMDNGKSILNGFDNNTGLITIIGFNNTNTIYCSFNSTYIIISLKSNTDSKKNIELNFDNIINKIKFIM
jgi:hypothetical protein